MGNPVVADDRSGKGVQMRLVARRPLQSGWIDEEKILGPKIAAYRRLDLVAAEQDRPPVGVAGRRPPG